MGIESGIRWLPHHIDRLEKQISRLEQTVFRLKRKVNTVQQLKSIGDKSALIRNCKDSIEFHEKALEMLHQLKRQAEDQLKRLEDSGS